MIQKNRTKFKDLTYTIAFKSYYKATIMNSMRYWNKDSQIDQQVRMENPEIDPHICGESIFDKNVKSVQCGNGKCFLTNNARISGYPHRKGKGY